MTSKRFPGKVLATFLNRPLLDHVVQQIKKSKIFSSIILATSTDNTDNPLASYAKELDLKVVRGSLDNVVERYALALDSYNCDAFFRVCGDSPLLLPSLFDYAVSIYRDKRYDVITNIFPRTFPVGMSVELIKTEAFLKLKKNILSQEEKEHLSKYFYNNFSNFKIFNIECNSPIDQNLKLAVDKYDDLEKIESWLSDKKDKFENLFPIKISK
tara:strand:- start:1753 stop:2391 length:639 start_codon:yes stop_codon:yes gene_type:complete